ncbi:hypothetical protein HaLaN_21737, partial [Haematococcus lacustris]
LGYEVGFLTKERREKDTFKRFGRQLHPTLAVIKSHSRLVATTVLSQHDRYQAAVCSACDMEGCDVATQDMSLCIDMR